MEIISIDDQEIIGFSKIKRKRIVFGNNDILILPISIFRKHGFKLKDNIEQGKYEDIISDIFNYEFNYVVKWLAIRERTELEIRKKLSSRMIKDSITENIIVKLKDLRYIDNDRLKEILIRGLFNKGYGKHHIEKVLRSKSIEYGSDDLKDLDFFKNCKKEYEKYIAKHGMKRTFSDIMKMKDHLYKKGYDISEIDETVGDL